MASFWKVDLGVQGFFDADASLDASFSSLYLSHDLLNILQLITAFPKHRYYNDKQCVRRV